MRTRAALWIFGSALSAIALAAGCGGRVKLEAGGVGGEGGEGTTTTTGPGSTTSTGVGGGAAQCGQTFESFNLDLQREDGTLWGCGHGPSTQEGELTFSAEVLEVWEGGYILNSCAPDANCAPTKEVLLMSAPGLPEVLPAGAFVEVRLSVYQPWGCEHHVLIRNLPQWGGLKNPYFSDDRLFLAAGDGNPYPLQGAPFGVETVALGCYPDAPPGCAVQEDYSLRFFQADQEGNTVTVPMGSTSEWKLLIPDGKFPVTVRNLRSFETGNCDDYWNWGYYVAAPPHL